jgi:hypothetical protein
MKAISFDFDGTLTRSDVQKFASQLISKGNRVCVLTSRLSDTEAPTKEWNNDLWDVCNSLGITEVYFTNGSWKFHYFDKIGIKVHLDDDNQEINKINSNKGIGISVWGNNSWENKIRRLI